MLLTLSGTDTLVPHRFNKKKWLKVRALKVFKNS